MTEWTGLAIMHEMNRPGEHEQLFDSQKMCSDACLINVRNRDSHRPESESDFSLDYRITFVLSGEPFLSVRQTGKKKMMSKSILYRHLTQPMRWKLRHLQGVPHSPAESEK
jgi:hypothetical protein